MGGQSTRHALSERTHASPSDAPPAPVMMAVALARLLKDGETVFHGVASPLPMVAILLAQRLHAPRLVYLNITGSVNPRPEQLPISTVDPALLHGTRTLVTLADLFDLAHDGVHRDEADAAGVDLGVFVRLADVHHHGGAGVQLLPGFFDGDARKWFAWILGGHLSPSGFA